MVQDVDTVIVSKEDRDALISVLSSKKNIVATDQLYAVITKLFQTQFAEFVPPSHIDWEDQTQDQKEFSIVFTAVGKNLGLLGA